MDIKESNMLLLATVELCKHCSCILLILCTVCRLRCRSWRACLLVWAAWSTVYWIRLSTCCSRGSKGTWTQHAPRWRRPRMNFLLGSSPPIGVPPVLSLFGHTRLLPNILSGCCHKQKQWLFISILGLGQALLSGSKTFNTQKQWLFSSVMEPKAPVVR